MNTNTQGISPLPQGVILDTNIISYASNTPTEKQFLEYLSDLQKDRHELIISQFSLYEILKQSKPKNESKLIQLLNLFRSLEVIKDVLVLSALLSTFYKSESKDRKIEDGDIIIAATAFLNNSLILTANRNDYPLTFFEEIKIKPILYQEIPGLTKTLTVYLLKPKSDLILKMVQDKLAKS